MVVLLASIIVAAPLQFAMQTPHPPSLNVHQGDYISSLLQEMAQSLNYGLPDGWEQLMYPPNTTGSYGIEPAYPSALRPVIETWRLDDEICEDALRDTHELVETAITDGVFLAQGFVYNTPMTSKVPSLVSLATLVVVAQIQYLVGTEVVQVQLGHLYMTSSAEISERCHPCPFISVCCSTPTLHLSELEDVKTVLSTHQSQWAFNQPIFGHYFEQRI